MHILYCNSKPLLQSKGHLLLKWWASQLLKCKWWKRQFWDEPFPFTIWPYVRTIHGLTSGLLIYFLYLFFGKHIPHKKNKETKKEAIAWDIFTNNYFTFCTRSECYKVYKLRGKGRWTCVFWEWYDWIQQWSSGDAFCNFHWLSFTKFPHFNLILSFKNTFSSHSVLTLL